METKWKEGDGAMCFSPSVLSPFFCAVYYFEKPSVDQCCGCQSLFQKGSSQSATYHNHKLWLRLLLQKVTLAGVM